MVGTVRVYYYGDSGPYGHWSRAADDQKSASDGWGAATIHEIPAYLWESYKAASDMKRAADDAIDTYIAERNRA